MVAVTSIEQLSGGRRRVHLDNGEVWVLYVGELRTNRLSEGASIPEDQYDRIRREVLGKRAKLRAMHLLERLDRTEQQLRSKLIAAEYPPDLIDEAIDYVRSYHYLDDARYADCYVRVHGTTKSQGMLRMELQRKGVASDTIDRTLAAQEDERDESAMIRELMQKRHFDPQNADAAERRRMYAYLQRRGFRGSDICREMQL